jgi:hypothetical protein
MTAPDSFQDLMGRLQAGDNEAARQQSGRPRRSAYHVLERVKQRLRRLRDSGE